MCIRDRDSDASSATAARPGASAPSGSNAPGNSAPVAAQAPGGSAPAAAPVPALFAGILARADANPEGGLASPRAAQRDEIAGMTGVPEGTRLENLMWNGLPDGGYADTGGPVARSSIGNVWGTETPADLFSILRRNIPFMLPPEFGEPPADLNDMDILRLTDLHWEGLAVVILPGRSSMVDYVPVADLPTLAQLANQVTGASGPAYPVRMSGRTLGSAGKDATFGAWVMDHAWTELMIRNGAAEQRVQYVPVGNWYYKQLGLALAEEAGTRLEDVWGFSQDAKVGNVFEYAAGQWALAANWDMIRTLLKSLVCIGNEPMAIDHRRGIAPPAGQEPQQQQPGAQEQPGQQRVPVAVPEIAQNVAADGAIVAGADPAAPAGAAAAIAAAPPHAQRGMLIELLRQQMNNTADVPNVDPFVREFDFIPTDALAAFGRRPDVLAQAFSCLLYTSPSPRDS